MRCSIQSVLPPLHSLTASESSASIPQTDTPALRTSFPLAPSSLPIGGRYAGGGTTRVCVIVPRPCRTEMPPRVCPGARSLSCRPPCHRHSHLLLFLARTLRQTINCWYAALRRRRSPRGTRLNRTYTTREVLVAPVLSCARLSTDRILPESPSRLSPSAALHVPQPISDAPKFQRWPFSSFSSANPQGKAQRSGAFGGCCCMLQLLQCNPHESSHRVKNAEEKRPLLPAQRTRTATSCQLYFGIPGL